MLRGVIMLFAVGACGTEHAPLHLDVVVTQQGVRVYTTEPGRPDAVMPVPFAHPGECDVTGDVSGCADTCPGEWLSDMWIEQGGSTIADWDASDGGGGVDFDTTTFDHAVLMIAAMDGTNVAVPIPDPLRPQPAIDDVTMTPSPTPPYQDVAITWHTAPASASTVVELANGYDDQRCHVIGDHAVTRATADIQDNGWTVYVTALAPPSLVHTDFGDAEVWVGAVASQRVTFP